MKLKNKVAIITGSTQGMGEAIAKKFSQEGASVVICGRNEERGNNVASEINANGGKAVFIAADVSIAADVEALVEKTIAQFGQLNILVPNAGVLGIGSILDVSLEDWHNTINTNLNGVFYLCKYGIPHLKNAEHGSIVINASIAAFKSFPNHPAYCASKGALVPFTKSLAIDHAPDKIRVNCICPGPVDTPLLWDSAKAFDNPETIVQEVGEGTLVGRLGTPDDIAKAALFLASEESSWITGTALTIDGGIMTGG